MPFYRLYYHIVWATSRRQPLIVPEIRAVLYRAITDKAESLGAKTLGIGGVEDHVHVAVSAPPTIMLSDFVGGVKGASAHHMNHLPQGGPRIEWQRGYGILSFSRDHLDRVLAYINGQEAHHGAAKLWTSLEDCGSDDAKQPTMVREAHVEYGTHLADAFPDWSLE